MHRIGILGGGADWLGGSNYIANVVRSLHAYRKSTERKDFEVVVALGGNEAERFDPDVLRKADSVIENDIYDSSASLSANLWSLVNSGRIDRAAARNLEFCRKNRLDAVFPSVFSFRRPVRVRGLAWIPDFGHVTNPEVNGAQEELRRDQAFREMSERAERIAFSSEDSLRHFAARYPSHAHKAAVYRFRATVPESEPPVQVYAKYGLPHKFAIICNQFWKHKNHLDAIAALARLKDVLPDLVLVCTGPVHDYRNPGHVDDVLHSIHTRGLVERVRLLGRIPRSDQVQLLRESALVLQPSSCEGWNTGVEECRLLGKTLILSDIAVHLEQRFRSCEFFRTGDIDHLAQAIRTAWPLAVPGPSETEDACRKEYENLVVQSAHEFLSALRLEQ